MRQAFEELGLRVLAPIRSGIHRFRRGSLPRNLCVVLLKAAQRAYGRKLPRPVCQIRPADRPDLTFEPVDSMVMVAIYWFGISGYEGRVTDVWITLCGRASAILEVGGNVGLFTVIGGKAATGRYTVLEPIPHVAAVLRANLARNDVAGVEILEAAAIPGEERCMVELNIPPERHGMQVGAHLVEGVEIDQRRGGNLLAAQGLPARDLFRNRDLIKIDAEGIEAELLASVRDIIVAGRPTLLVEVLPEAARLGTLLRSLAEEVGYTIFIIPEYGSDVIVSCKADAFDSTVPKRNNSKDVVLSVAGL